jgi:hypothetical protein
MRKRNELGKFCKKRFLSSINVIYYSCRPILKVARSKTWVYGCLLAGVADSNPSEGMDVSVVFCQVEFSARTYHSSRGDLL